MSPSPSASAADTTSGRPEIVLLGSPLLGQSVWAPVDRLLDAHGWKSCIVQLSQSPQPVPRNSILVAHSNAGAYVPELALRSDVIAVVFVDAILPKSEGSTPLAPPAAIAHLTALADKDGLLPPWTRWWDESDVAELFPNAESRRLVESDEPRLPLEYFLKSLDAAVGWDSRPGAYLAFGETYAAERADAENRGWPTRTLDGHHLHMLVDPMAVTTALLDLVAAITEDSGFRPPQLTG